MTAVTSCTARLVFAPETHVAFDRIATFLSKALDHQNRPVTAGHSVSSATRFVATADSVWCLEQAEDRGETLVSLTVDSTGADYRAMLVHVLYRLAQALPVTHLIWGDCDLRLPRSHFLDQLASECSDQVKTPRPRRITLDPQRQTRARPSKRLAGDALLARMLPVISAATAWATANDNGYTRRDASLAAHNHQLRTALTAPVAGPEMADIRSEIVTAPDGSDLSHWAQLLMAARISQPAIAQNLMKTAIGSRATISVGLAAMFLLLFDGSSAMAALLSTF